MKVEIQYIRSCGDLNEHVLYEELEFSSKTQALKHARETKKKIASECHYRFPRDIVNYIIKEIK
jgi:hypothetical protein